MGNDTVPDRGRAPRRGVSASRPAALVSVHDVAPDCLPAVRHIVEKVRCPGPVTLLVIPGADWTLPALDALRALAADGCELAGHGWQHRCDSPRGFGPRLHSALISRNAGEHLCRNAADSLALIARCHAWFAEHGFPPPRLYVPPAWTLGALKPARLRDTPFDRVELLSGVHLIERRRTLGLPLVGFEADTAWRRRFLLVFNRVNLAAARLLRRPVRIAVHPNDPALLMANDLDKTLGRIGCCLSYDTLTPKGRGASRIAAGDGHGTR